MNRLKELRKESQQKIAEKFGITQRTYSNYESGCTQIPDDLKIRLAEYFGVSVDYLLGRTENALDRRPTSDIAENFIKEFGELFSDENFQKLAGIYKVMNEIQRREILLYLIGYARGAGIDTKIIGY